MTSDHYTVNTKYIQHAWCTYRCRKVAYHFKRLPTDLQNKIAWYIKEPHLITIHHHKPIAKIIRNRTKLSIIHNITPLDLIDLSVYVSEVRSLCNLYTKYGSIIPDNDKCEFRTNISLFYDIILDIFYIHDIVSITDIYCILHKIKKFIKEYI